MIPTVSAVHNKLITHQIYIHVYVWIQHVSKLSRSNGMSVQYIYTNTHTHIYICIYIYKDSSWQWGYTATNITGDNTLSEVHGTEYCSSTSLLVHSSSPCIQCQVVPWAPMWLIMINSTTSHIILWNPFGSHIMHHSSISNHPIKPPY